MRNVTETWRRITLPLDGVEKVIVFSLGVAFLFQVFLFVRDPSWGGVVFMVSNLSTVAVFWRWFWVEGYHRMFRSLTDMGAAVGNHLHAHGDVLVTKHGDKYRITPLTVERDS